MVASHFRPIVVGTSLSEVHELNFDEIMQTTGNMARAIAIPRIFYFYTRAISSLVVMTTKNYEESEVEKKKSKM